MATPASNHDRARIRALEQQNARLEFRMSRMVGHDEAEQLRRDRTAALQMLAHAVQAAGGKLDIPREYHANVPKLAREGEGRTITLTTRSSRTATLMGDLPQYRERKPRFVSITEAVEGEEPEHEEQDD